jgi:type I restriction enzyme S subunit
VRMNEAILPSGWAIATIGDLADYVNGRAFKPTEWKDAGRPIIRIQNLNNEEAKYNFSPENHEEKYMVGNGDLLFAWSASLGAYIWHGSDAWLNQHIFIVHAKSCTTKLFVFYLLEKITAELYAKAHGSGMVHVTKGKFESTGISLPPLPEQHRIVAKIEELFSELDKGIESLKTAQAQLKVYRQALLKHAFEGKLTTQWREENKDKLETADALLKRIQVERERRYWQQLAEWEAAGKQGSKPKAPKILPPLTAEELAGLPELPDEWGWVRVGEIADVQLGRQRSPNNRSNNFPTKYIRAGNLTDNGLSLEDVLDMEFEPQERARFLLKAGDVLLSEASGSANQVGKPAVWRSEIEECCFQNTVIRVRSLDELSEYLFWVFKTYYISGVFYKLSSGVGINHLSAGKLENMAIPLVAIFESKKILVLINEKLSLIANLDQTITIALQQADALRQSILKKAFFGQLVPQDPHDEPASALLARIKAERSTHSNHKKVRE